MTARVIYITITSVEFIQRHSKIIQLTNMTYNCCLFGWDGHIYVKQSNMAMCLIRIYYGIYI